MFLLPSFKKWRSPNARYNVDVVGLTLLLLAVVHDVSPLQPTMALSKDLSTTWQPSVFQQLVSFLALENNAEQQGVDTLVEHIHSSTKASATTEGMREKTVFIRHYQLHAPGSRLSSPTSETQQDTESFGPGVSSNDRSETTTPRLTSTPVDDIVVAKTRWITTNVTSFTQQLFAAHCTVQHPFVHRTSEMVEKKNLFPSVYTMTLPQSDQQKEQVDRRWKCAQCGHTNLFPVKHNAVANKKNGDESSGLSCTRCHKPRTDIVGLYFGNLPSIANTPNDKKSLPAHYQWIRTLIEEATGDSLRVFHVTPLTGKQNHSSAVVYLDRQVAERVTSLLHRNVWFYKSSPTPSLQKENQWEVLFVYEEQRRWLELLGAAAAASMPSEMISGRYALIVEPLKHQKIIA